MRFAIRLAAETADGPVVEHVIANIERPDGALPIDELGLSIEDAKAILAALQVAVVETQARDLARRRRPCPCCGAPRRLKDHRTIRVRTPFSKLAVPSPRYRWCGCEPASGVAAPVVAALPERVTPDLLELEARWASLMAYGVTAERLSDVLPVGETINAVAIRNDALRVAERLEAELGPEQRGFIEGCPRDWEEMSLPGPPVTVGIDRGYVRSWADRPSNFEVIVGKSVVDPEEDGTTEPTRRFGFVVGHDAKPRRWLHEVLREQGVGMNREVTFMSDGEKGVRDLQWAMRPNAEHVLDYFHIAMRVTVMQQIARGLPPAHDETKTEIVARLERVRRFLWHGNGRRALEIISHVEEDVLDIAEPDGLLEADEGPLPVPPQARKLLRHLREFGGYITDNARMIPNYAERRRNSEVVSTAFVESTVNQVVAKHCVKAADAVDPEGHPSPAAAAHADPRRNARRQLLPVAAGAKSRPDGSRGGRLTPRFFMLPRLPGERWPRVILSRARNGGWRLSRPSCWR